MMEPSRDPGRTYDEIPYAGGPIPGMHPDVLAVAAILWSLEPPPPESCRVFELGCGTGENLIPMAVAQPDAEFVGIDASARQIEQGCAQIDALGLHNIELHCRRIEDEVPATSSFDYVLCHGVYSWVPPPVRERLLALCRALLSPRGLAYVSYNTQPGWYLRQQFREMLLFHVRDLAGTRARLSEARRFVDFLLSSLAGRNDAYGRVLHQYAEELTREPDAYVFHEFLEEDNTPLFFHEFVERAAQHGLQYVAEGLARQHHADLPAAARAWLEAASPDRIAAEQYLDFLEGRAFRRSILCHREARPAPAEPRMALPRLRVAAAVRSETTAPDVFSAAAVAFRNARGARLETNHPVVKTALLLLAEHYPRSLPFPDVWREVAQRLRAAGVEPPPDWEHALADSLHQCHGRGFLELHVAEPAFVLDISEQPCASALARMEAAAQSAVVTSLRHHLVAVQPFEQRVLAQLDGATKRAQLLERMAEWERDPAHAQVAGAPDAGSLAERVDLTLRRFARTGLLAG